MRMLMFVSLATGAGSLAAMPADAQQTGTPPPPPPGMTVGPMVSPGGPVLNPPDWSARINGRWAAGYQAPGGWAAYRTPVEGFILPGFWLQPGYIITDYGYYGLPAPPAGYGWSRYYDDAVLTDRYGKVHESRIGYDWSRAGTYGAAPIAVAPAPLPPARLPYERPERGDSGQALAGAAIGGVTGGLIGGAIGGPGGAVIGAGVGAIAGAVALDKAADEAPGYGYAPYGAPYQAGSDPYRRSLTREERKLLEAEAEQRRKLDKLARKAGYASYDAYLRARAPQAYAPAPYPAQPHWAVTGGPEGGALHGPGAPRVVTHQMPGYYANGYYYPGAIITTITLEPTVTETVTTTTTSYASTATRKAAKATGSKIVSRKVVRAN